MIKNPYLGKFIVFEGLDGSGQSTQAAKLVDFLNLPESKNKLGHAGAHLTKEPTSNLIGGLIRSQLSHDWKSSQECLQLLFSADRAHHLEKEIMPLLERGVTVSSDRYFFSTIAYGSLDIKDRDWLVGLNKNFLLPDITFFLRVSAKVCLERINRSRFEVSLFEREDFLTKVCDNFERLAKEFENIYVINGERPIDKIHQEIIEIVNNKLR
ncbi:MAG: dTMP kinase [Candidatus Nealsonbacteria bacterium]|nr:dTMP kinase [Candidatus Nealsonbacteria bacterium]